MSDDFPCQQQQSNWSCLPFAVQSVLLYNNLETTLDSIYDWCRAGQDGIPGACRWPESVAGLRRRFPESDEIARGDWSAVEEALVLGDIVIVTIAEPRAEPSVGDHAVVILSLSDKMGDFAIRYCDPSDGKITDISFEQFLLEWDMAGGKAFVLRP